MDPKQDSILYLTFNQDQACFSVGTENGFKIYNTSPYKETFSRDLGGGIRIVEMLYRCNILALVGGGKNPKFPPNKVMLWDDHQTRCIGELSFRSEVQAVKLRTDRIIIVLENKIFCYNFSDLKLLDCIETCPNPKGLCSVNTEQAGTIVACPDKTVGNVLVRFYEDSKTECIKAHQSALSAIQLNSSGTLLATASEKGTIIRIFDLKIGGVPLQELRRGSEYAIIHSICFDNLSQWLACTSDSGTIHIFNLKKSAEKDEAAKNPKSKLSFMKVISSYFDSEWSFAQYKLQDQKSVVAFVQQPDPTQLSNTIAVLSQEGKFHLANFDIQVGGDCAVIEKQDITCVLDDKIDNKP